MSKTPFPLVSAGDEMIAEWRRDLRDRETAKHEVWIIGGVAFRAIRHQRPVPHWHYAVGDKEGPQGYPSRPKMWADLEHAFKLRGPEQWLKDWAKFQGRAQT